MPVTIEWGNEDKTAVHMRFLSPWNWEEYYQSSAQGWELVESVDHQVHVILDFTKSNGDLPPSAITHFKRSISRAHPRRGTVVVVSKRAILMRTIIRILQSLIQSRSPLVVAGSVEEAYTILAAKDEDDDRPKTVPIKDQIEPR